MKRRLSLLACASALLALPGLTGLGPFEAHATIFLPGYGFEDDVDLVVAPNGHFLVVPEEAEDGSAARVRIVDLDDATGEPIGLPIEREVDGFENGVDPMVLQAQPGVDDYGVLIPVESEDGTQAGVLILRLDDAGALIEERWIDLGDLGFREDVDGAATVYPDHLVAFFALESENLSVRGVLAIDMDTRFADFGKCTLLSTDGRAGCDEGIEVDWLPGLVDGADPVAYRIDDAARMVLPIAAWDGADLLLIDFDPSIPGLPPEYLRHFSVREINEAGARPTDFPGFERDVDVAVFDGGTCGFAERRLLVPVEGSGEADLYLLDEDGIALRVFSIDDANRTIPGFETGVDVVPMCGGGGEHPDRLIVPVEEEGDGDADVWILDISTLEFLASAEEQTPGFMIPGFEIGVDVVRWTFNFIAVPVEGPVGGSAAPGLIVLDQDANVVDARLGGEILGYIRSVDPIVDREASPRVLYVPVGRDDGSDADVLIYPTPPSLDGISIEEFNEGEVLEGFEWDVDLGLVDKISPGGDFLYLPEEPPAGGDGRLRFEDVPSQTRLVIATAGRPAPPATLYFIGDAPLGRVVIAHEDLLGLETGLDMAGGRGPVTPVNQPLAAAPAGRDADTDPTLDWIVATSDVLPAADVPAVDLRCANPFRAPGPILFSVARSGPVRIEVFDPAGRRVRQLMDGPVSDGEHTVFWDGRSDRGRSAPNGIYWIRIAGPQGETCRRLLIVR